MPDAPETLHLDCDETTTLREVTSLAASSWGRESFATNSRVVMGGRFTHVPESDARLLYDWALREAEIDLSKTQAADAFVVASNLAPKPTPRVTCRICLGEEVPQNMFRPCLCKGSMSFVHRDCLNEWRIRSANPRAFYECQQCRFRYDVRKVEWAEYVESKVFESLLVVCALTATSLAVGVAVCASPLDSYALRLLVTPFPFLHGMEGVLRVLTTGAVVLGAISFFAVQLYRLYAMFVEPGDVRGGALFLMGFASNSVMILRIFSTLGLLMAYNEMRLAVSKRVRLLLTRAGEYIVEP